MERIAAEAILDSFFIVCLLPKFILVLRTLLLNSHNYSRATLYQFRDVSRQIAGYPKRGYLLTPWDAANIIDK
jgi:hypothetical protein